MLKEFSITTLQPYWEWLDNLSRSRKSQIQTSADAQPGPQFLGGVGRLEHGWDGLVHLLPRAGSGIDRTAAPFGNSRDHRQHWRLRRIVLRAFYDRLRNGLDLGADCRSLRPRSHDDVQHILLFTFHDAGRFCHGSLEPGGFSF